MINTKVILGSFLSTWLICTPAWADDTEIYFGGSTATNVNPNVMFILDTSGSMQEYDGGSISRSDRMKQALSNVLNSSSNINVGLMRFTSPGGPVLYPIRNIDGTVSSATSSITGSVSQIIRYSEDDAEQLSDGTVYTDSNLLETITSTTNLVVEKRVTTTTDTDTAEQNATGKPEVSTSSGDLDLMHDTDGSEKLVGIRFRAINVPQNATITNAYIQFTVDEYDEGDLSVRIWGEGADNPIAFQAKNNDISGRVRTTANVDWLITNTPSVGQTLQTPAITSIVQELVNRGGWVSGNNMAFMIENLTGTSANRRVVESGGSTTAPLLRIEYQPGGTGGTAQTIGLRFNEVTVPRGATVTSANLVLKAGASDAASATMTMQGEYAGHSEPFSATNNDLSTANRPRTVNSVGWTGVPAWTEGSSYTTPSLITIVQEIVSKSDWCGGNSLSLFLKANDERVIAAFEDNVDNAARLNITYDVGTIPSPTCIANEYTANITDVTDDAEQAASGVMTLDSTDLDMGQEIVGLRYQDIPLNAGADIKHAYIEFTADEADNVATSLTISGVLASNASTFTTATNNISGRTKTVASVSWSPSIWGNVGGVHRSPNIAAIIKEIVAVSGWAPGNSMAFVIEGTGDRTANAEDGSSTPPRLVYYAQASDTTGAERTVRDELLDAIDGIPHKGGTPIVDTLYEAARYFRGEGIEYGDDRGSGTDATKALTRVSHPESYTGGTLYRPSGCTDATINTTACAGEEITGSPTYISPIGDTDGDGINDNETCQANYIVLLTDGEANNNNSVSEIEALTGVTCSGSGGEQCGIDLANYLFTQDQIDDADLADDQIIRTYTIGLEFSTQWLTDLAQAGGGSFYLAESVDNLTDTFDTIIKQIKASNSTFVEPSVTINQFNRFAHRDDVYFALFKPQETAKWYGNLKKYQLKGNPAELYDNSNPQKPAVDPDTGFFGINSQSFWSVDEDGNQVEKGGAASMQTVTRNIFTNVSSNAVLSATENKLHETNTLVTDVLLDIVGKTADYREDLIQWGRGLDENGAARKALGDPLHSRPELVTYDGFANPIESTIFFGTNEGYLHAVNINTGAEQFSFIPKELLGNLDTFFTDTSVTNRPYGLDGGITLWTKDINGDGDLKDTGEFAYLYVGMRRGGRSYYALDVSDVNNPELMWQIDGGSGSFADLGQTWSRPTKTKIKMNNVAYDVLVFGGGYDPNQDNVSTRTIDSFGNAVFMIDATTGAKLWSAGNSGGTGHTETVTGMDYSIPSDVRVLDMNRDGYADQMYVGDMGGQIWRFDIDNEQTQWQHLVDVTKIANFADSTAAGNRRFYYAPDLALAVQGSHRYLSLGIGSGYRAHPRNLTIEDRFYMVKLFDVYEKPSSFTTLTESDLHDATSNNIQSSDAATKSLAENELSNDHVSRKEGWMIKLTNAGEKVLASSATIQNQMIFTTYEPKASSGGNCNPAQGTSRAYLVSLTDATPMLDINKDGTVNVSDRVIQLAIGSIPSTPTVIDTLESKPTVWVGPEKLSEVDTDVESTRTYWIEVLNP